MAENHSGSGVVFRRALAVVVALALLTSLAQVAAAEPSTEERLDAAKAEFEQLKNQIASQQEVLNRLSAEAAVIAERWEVANGRWEQVTAELRQTQLALAEAQAEYQDLKADLEERARQAYITGPGSGLEFLLGATSIGDLSARMEYVNALSQEDADLATEVQNVRNTLSAKKEDQEKLQTRRARALKRVESEQAALDAKFDEQQAVLGSAAATWASDVRRAIAATTARARRNTTPEPLWFSAIGEGPSYRTAERDVNRARRGPRMQPPSAGVFPRSEPGRPVPGAPRARSRAGRAPGR